MEAEEEQEEEGPPEPGLSAAGQYLCASCIAFWAAAVAVLVSYLHFGEFPMHVGLAIIVLPIFLLCVVISIIGFLAKPKKKEKLFLIFTLGPIGPLAGAVVFGMAFFKAFSGG